MSVGNDVAWDEQAVPLPVSLAPRVVQISVGNEHSAFLLDDGSVFTCGLRSHGRLGCNKNSPEDPSLQQVPLQHMPIIELACGAAHTLTLAQDGTVISVP